MMTNVALLALALGLASGTSVLEGPRSSTRALAPLVPGAVKRGRKNSATVLFLMSDTGGGHRASAQALEAALLAEIGTSLDLNIELVDIWTLYGTYPYNRQVGAYSFFGKHPRFWKALYYWYSWWPGRRMDQIWSTLTNRRRMAAAIQAHNPDMIVSVHPMTQTVPINALDAIQRRHERARRADLPARAQSSGALAWRRPPFATVVTDLNSAHPMWFHRRADLVFVPSKDLHKRARWFGVPELRIRQHGLPVRKEFWQRTLGEKETPPDAWPTPDAVRALAKAAAKKRLGLDPERPVVLVVMGGDGFGANLESMVGRLVARLSLDQTAAQIVVVCGRNDEMRRKIEAKHCTPALGSQGSGGGPQLGTRSAQVVALGFVDYMHELMDATDCLLTKAGPGTIAEAAIKALPVVVTSYLPGQEAGNVRFVTENGFGVFEPRPREAAQTVSIWLRNPDLMALMARQASKAGRPSASKEIARDLAAALKQHLEIA